MNLRYIILLLTSSLTVAAYGGTVLNPISSGQQIYVAVNGNDSSPGTSTAPVRTIQRGVDLANPGDTVVVRDGTYGPEGAYTCGDTCGVEHATVNIGKAGTASAWITLKAEHKWAVTLDSQLQGDSYINLKSGAAYISIEDFQFTAGYWEGIHSNESAHHIMIRGNHFHHIGNRVYNPSGTSFGIVGVFIGTSTHDYVFDGNVFNNIGRLPGNLSTSYNHDHGLYIYGSNVTVMNNVFYNLQAGWAIQISPGVSNHLIANNTFSGANPQRDGQIELWGSHSNIIIRDNIFYNPRNYAIDKYQDQESGSSIDHNLVYGATDIIGSSTSGLSLSNNTTGADPLFVNPSAYDFHLSPGSPAAGAGVAVPECTTDMDDSQRPINGAYSLGAYELASLSAQAKGPSVSISANGSSFTASSNIGLSATAVAGSSPVSRVDFYAGQSLIGSAYSSPYAMTWYNVSGGSYAVKAIATDSAGLTGSSNTLNLSVTSGAPAPPPISSASKPDAYWNFNEGRGTVASDASGHGFSATLKGAGWGSGHSGSGLKLNGSGYADVSGATSLGAGSYLTVAFWVAPQDVPGTDERLISKRYSWDLKLNGDSRRPQFSASGSYATLNYSAALWAWQHIAFTFSSGVMHGYVNGIEVPFLANTFSSGQSLQAQTYGFAIGADSSNSSAAKGSMDDVVIYNRALSGAEVATLYSSGVQ